ncbi:MAG: hydantoinase/oxoprolinase family protein, partial [Pirellulaceae bacterium]
MTARFAIDVGGTFTDCVAVDAQQRRQRLKVLSSSVVKGVATGAAERWIDPMRRVDAVGFWRDATLRSLDANGMPHDEARVLESDPSTGLLLLERPLQGVGDRPISYELTRGEPAPLLAIRQALRLAGDEPIPAVDVRLGTTRGTNALLTRTGARTAWVTTRGFADAISIGDQQRPRLFELAIRKPSELFAATAEVDERLDAHGQVLIPIDLDQTRRELERLRAAGIESLAICLLHAYLAPEHELQVARIARELGFPAIRLSHQSAPVIKLVARGRTTLVDAYLDLVLRDYLRAIEQGLGAGSQLSLMTSAGDLVSPERFSGKDSLLSGPAGGVVALAEVSRVSGGGRGIGFDMGGTSTDVSRFDGRLEIESESHKADVAVVVPTLAIETVAAGGGSICRVVDGRLQVGPESAGADPGPACYGRGGPLSVTDLNVWLGRVGAERFPFPLDRAA